MGDVTSRVLRVGRRVLGLVVSGAFLALGLFAVLCWATWPREPDWRPIMEKARAENDVETAEAMVRAVLPGRHAGVFRAAADIFEAAGYVGSNAGVITPRFVAGMRGRAEEAERASVLFHRIAENYGDSFIWWHDGPIASLYARTCGRMQEFAKGVTINHVRLRRGMARYDFAKPQRVRGDIMGTRVCAEFAWWMMGRDTRMESDHGHWWFWSNHDGIPERRAMGYVLYLTGENNIDFGISSSYKSLTEYLRDYWTKNPEECHQWAWLLKNSDKKSIYAYNEDRIRLIINNVCQS